jgi:hypothetical protein
MTATASATHGIVVAQILTFAIPIGTLAVVSAYLFFQRRRSL